MANFAYKKQVTTSMKLVGYLDTDRMVITVDDEEKDIKTLLKDFNGADVTINVKVSSDEELEEPVEDEE